MFDILEISQWPANQGCFDLTAVNDYCVGKSHCIFISCILCLKGMLVILRYSCDFMCIKRVQVTVHIVVLRRNFDFNCLLLSMSRMHRGLSTLTLLKFPECPGLPAVGQSTQIKVRRSKFLNQLTKYAA